MRKIYLLAVFLINTIPVIASVFNGEAMSFKQPDGTQVDIKLYGTEYYMRGESLDGYTVIRDTKTNWICYATLSEDKKSLISTGIVYKGVKEIQASWRTDIAVVKHLDIDEKSRSRIINNNGLMLKPEDRSVKAVHKTTGTPINAVSGHIKGLCIVIDFSDEVGTLPMNEFEQFCNDLNYNHYGNNGSLRKYYKDVSGGLLDYENAVFGYFRAPLTFAQYDAMPYAQGAQQILGLALHWLDSVGFDFSTLSINPDGTIKAINMMYTGTPLNWAQGMWHHRGTYTLFTADGVTSKDYNCSPANAPLSIGTVCHENGHMLCNWPDTYKYDGTTGPDGIGAFDLMCAIGDYSNPVPPNPLFRSNVGWGKVVDITNYNGLRYDTANAATCYKYVNINDTDEFFLFESRMHAGRNMALPDDGLTIWHIDRNGDNQTTHHEVWLEHADNYYLNENHACFKSSGNHELAINTTPNSDFYNGDPSGLRIWDISNVASIMNYKLGLPQPGPSLNILYNNFTDNNGNGSIEAGESVIMHVTALNLGQLNSASATIKCTAIGANAGYVMVNTAPIALGVINVSQSIPSSFNITISQSIPLASEIQLRFTLSDGVDSIYITRKFLVGQIILMNDNTPVTTCSAIFFDEGGTGNYYENADYIKTFFPSATGQAISVHFSGFELEDELFCNYDYLKIYDGPDTNATLLGKFCGNINPGVFTSSHSSGALTFRFVSDAAVSYAGWQATVSCNAINNIEQSGIEEMLSITPNPSGGFFIGKTQSDKGVKIDVVDLLGRSVYHQNVVQKGTFTIDLSGYPDGIYLVKYTIGNVSATRKIVISR